ncbi:hypothetical protein BJX61DRAFT_30391 [Aspergillus egyptiacus]|nr:hypothetical protein BJX61DRAFT_30391 [Aspergillus egyptiacus]
MSTQYRMQRSKSGRSIQSSYNSSLASKPFDPELARLYATAAACRAMSRSREGSSTSSYGTYGRLGGPRSMAVPARRHRRSESSNSSGYSSTTGDRYSTTTPDNDQAWSAALPSISEFGGLEDRIASLPSSYRRLRKSRSMFSTKQRSPHIHYGLASPKSYSPSIAKGSTPEPPRLYRTLRRSMSFLRGDSSSQKTLRHAKSHDVAIALARSQYEQDILNSPDSNQVPPLPMPKVRREHKPFRKTFRNTSTSERTVATSPMERVKATEAHGKARAFSSSIKKGIKRVLGISRNSSQQGNAQASPSSSHGLGRSPSTVISNENSYPDGRSSFAADDSRRSTTAGQTPTVRRMQSSASLATSRSRVTSWADSTAANTLATPKSGGQRRQSMMTRRESLGQVDMPPLPTASTQMGPSNAVDSQRLFSALMKRIGETKAQNPDEEIHLRQVNEHRAVPMQGPLSCQPSRQTIRQIPSDISINSPKSFATAKVDPATPYEPAQGHSIANVPGLNRAAYRSREKVTNNRLRDESDSPSVYSRSINGSSPQIKATTDSPGSEAEPGIATIFASERTAYVSPKKLASEVTVSAHPGTDWQNWMDSQIARIENASPTRHHYRENAEIQDDYATALTSTVPSRRIRVDSRGMRRAVDDSEGPSRKVSTSSNFSRPFSRSSTFSRSSSLRTVVKVQGPSSASRPVMSPSTSDDVFRDSGVQESFLKSSRAGQNELGVSPMLLRSSNQPRTVESPTPKRYATDVSPKLANTKYGQTSTKRSPAVQDTRMLHRRSARYLRENRKATNENSRIEQGVCDQTYSIQSPMSSKRMVELFLNSRRRQMGADVSDDGASETAFL